MCCALIFAVAAVRADDLSEGWTAFRNGQYDTALDKARSTREITTLDPGAWRLEAQALMTYGRYEEAYRLLVESQSVLPTSLRLRLLCREAALRAGHAPEAAQQLQELGFLISGAPRYRVDTELLASTGEAALLLGVEPRLVLENFLKPAQADPVSPSRDAFLAAGKLALSKRDYAVASRTFQEGLKKFIDDPDLWWGLAAAFENGDRAKLVDYATQALLRDPHHIPTRLLIAEHRIDSEDYAGAESELQRVRAINPNHPEGLALLAVIAHLQNRPFDFDRHRAEALATWATNPQVDHLIGRKLSQRYRFAEGAEAQRRALAFDATFTAARIQLAQDLLRLGRDDEGWTHTKQAHAEDPYDVTAYNLTVLQDQLGNFTTLTTPHFRLRMSSKEASLYGQRALALLERARESLTQKYGLTLDERTTVEIYPDPKDFAVRTFGMPGHPGYLGVCFGPVFTVNSPATQRANWESVLWHEFCHVITLTLTRNRMPRWLSEGISVYEEQQANPAWGRRMTPGYQKRILEGKMQPVREMSAAFIQGQSSEDIQFAYFQSALVVQFMVETYGFDAMKALLQALREGTAINAALARHVAPLDELEHAFVPFAQKAAKHLGNGYVLNRPADGIAAALSQLNPRNLPAQLDVVQALMKQKQWAEAKTKLLELTRKTGYVPGEPSAHALLARVCNELGDAEGERDAWSIVASHESDALPAVSRLLALAEQARDWPAMKRWSDAWLAINPLAPKPWRALLDAGEGQSVGAEAVAAGQMLLLLDPPDVAAVHYRVARQLMISDQAEARKHVLLALAEAPRYRAAYELLNQLPEAAATP